jgi:hypothetical protein
MHQGHLTSSQDIQNSGYFPDSPRKCHVSSIYLNRRLLNRLKGMDMLGKELQQYMTHPANKGNNTN